MSSSFVLPPDPETFLIEYLRGELRRLGASVEVGPVEPTDLRLPLEKPMVVVRNDSGPRESLVTFDQSFGVSVLAGSKMDDAEANRIGRLAMAVLTCEDIIHAPGSPIAAIQYDGCAGPYAVEDRQDVARRYLTVEYTVVGSW